MQTIPHSSSAAVSEALDRLADPRQAAILQRFFKTGPGEYGQGDQFLGIKVPPVRAVAKMHRSLPLAQVQCLLRSPVHEKRLAALVILVLQFAKADAGRRQRIYDLYLRNTRWINNWDLVDVSAEHIVGGYLFDKDRDVLLKLARSPLLWERRIAMVATFYFIRRCDFAYTLRLARMLLKDEHDLIHKAAGWMLREVGKRDVAPLRRFLDTHAGRMPRTMLRYAIERLPEAERRHYMEQ